MGDRAALEELQGDLGTRVVLLADPQAAAVSAFGMLDPDPFPPGRQLARAGTVLIGGDGTILRWWLPDYYRERPDPDEILAAIP